MAEEYSIGPYRGHLLLNLDRLFLVIRLLPPLPERSALERAIRVGGIPAMVFVGNQAGCIGSEAALWGPSDPSWEESLLAELKGKDPLSAEELAESALQANLIAASINYSVTSDNYLQGLETFLARRLDLAQQHKQYRNVAQLAQQLDRLQMVRKALANALEVLRLPADYSGNGQIYRPGTALGVKQTKAPAAKNHATPRMTSRRAYRLVLLRTIQELGGVAASTEVLATVFKCISPQLTPNDLTLNKKREPLWRNRCRWQIADLKVEGLVASAGKGIWAITEAGRRYLEEHHDLI